MNLLPFVLVLLAAGATATPRTPWGDPDIQGTWPGGPVFAVPFERDPAAGNRLAASAEEIAQRKQDAALAEGFALGNFFPEVSGRIPEITSLISDPENGRLPQMTEDGSRRAAQWRVIADPEYPAAGAEELRPYDRCISRGVLGSAFPNSYSSGMQIHQSPGFVVVVYEMIHEARIIPISTRAHLSPKIRGYLGDARGHWEGDTLVVETTNFNGLTGSYARNGDGNPTSTSLRLVEKFKLLDRDTLSYEVRVEDPETWTRPWTVAFPIPRNDTYTMFEYACHEGNYAISNILSTARAAERRDGERARR